LPKRLGKKGLFLEVEIGEILEGEVLDLTLEGEGVVKPCGFTVFVPFALPGEQIKFKITQLKKNYGRGELLDLIKASPFRIEPLCPLHFKCGGCTFGHLTYEEELALKTKISTSIIQRIGKLNDFVFQKAIKAPSPYRYRNKATLHYSISQKRLGYYIAKSNTVLPFEDCLLLPEALNQLIRLTEKILERKNIEGIDDVTFRYSFSTAEKMIIFHTAYKAKVSLQKAAEMLFAEDEKLMGIVAENGKAKTVLKGKNWFSEKIEDLTFRLSSSSFMQINPKQARALYVAAEDYSELTGKENLLDLYCGIGTFTLFLAKKAAKATGIEQNKEAISDALFNARQNNLEAKTQFICGKTEETIAQLFSTEKFEVIMADPPRAGIREAVLENIVQSKIERLVYVSCNPATLARDLKFLSVRSFDLSKAQLIDMFPRTGHVETVCLLTSKIKAFE